MPVVDFLCFIYIYIFLSFLYSLCSIPLNDYKLLVCDIQQLLVAVTIHACSSSGSQYFRIIEDLITLLGFMQTSRMRRTQGEDWISETQHPCNIHQCCHQLCFTFLNDIKLSGSAALRNWTVTDLYTTAELKLIWGKKFNLRNISLSYHEIVFSFFPAKIYSSNLI